jgi:HTH-type transcriptional regulator, sugar sensing transcriptional regulator
MIEKITKIFKEFNLTENDAKLYLKALETGATTVSKLAKLLNMDQSSAYKAFGRLEYCGFFEKEAGKTYGQKIVAKDPRRIYETFFKKKANTLRRRELEFKDLLSELLAVYKEENKPGVKFYNGKEGFWQMHEDILAKTSKEMLCFGNTFHQYKIFGTKADSEFYIPKRLEKNIRCRMLVFEDEFTKDIPKKDEQELRETKFLDKQKFNFDGAIMITDNDIFLFTPTQENFGLTIASNCLTKMIRNLFEYIWNNS